MKHKVNITTLKEIRNRMQAVATACNGIPAGADGQRWLSLAPGLMVRVADLRAFSDGYDMLLREIDLLRKQFR
jgi:hypothetical protein